MSITTVLVADDHPTVRNGIRYLLEKESDFDIVAEASDGEEAVRLAGELFPNVVIMDIGMPKLNGLEATQRIKSAHPEIAVIALTVHDEDEYILGLLEAGAAGYLLKTVLSEELVQAIKLVRGGEFVFHPLIVQRLLKRFAGQRFILRTPEGTDYLTVREIEVLRLAAQGLTNKDIALEIGVHVRTVKGHLVSIFSKMRVASRTEAVLQALKKGIITLEESTDKTC